MYEIVRSVITAGGYKLAEIQYKIKKMYILGDLTEEQMDDLLALAAQGVSTDAERPEVLEMLCSLADRVAALEKRMDNQKDAGEDVGGEEVVTYPAWKPWDGISQDYQMNAIVSHNGKLWQSVFAGQNVWEPGAPGTEALWGEFTPDEEV